MQHFKWLSLLILLPSILLASDDNEDLEPIYAGTLLAFYPENIDPGRLSFQPYVFATRAYGIYEQNWSILRHQSAHLNTLLIPLETGITDYLDVSLYMSLSYDKIGHKHSWNYGDTSLYFGLQILRDKKGTWTPDLRFLLGEIFPTGKYQRLDPAKLLIDSAGTGSYQTSAIVVLRKIFYTYPHPFNININLFYNLLTHTQVKGFNTYGGGPDTHGTVHPGNIFMANLAFELSITRLLEIGLDIHYEHQNKSPFSGHSSFKTGLPSSERFSLAPCIEYNFSEDMSIAAGSWFTVAGRNNNAFVSWVANFFYMF